MPKPYRRIVFFGFLGVFLLFAPLLILYTAGYRYNWQRRGIQETGVLTLDTLPRDASVIVNGETQRKRLPMNLSGLLPGRFTIEIAKEGYYAWKKRLWIEPSRTTFAQHMVLWKETPEKTALHRGRITQFVPSSGEYSGVVTREQKHDTLALLSSKTNSVAPLSVTDDLSDATIKRLLWSPRGRRLFIDLDGIIRTTRFAVRRQLVWHAADGIVTPLAQLAGERPLENVSWNGDDDDRLYGFQRLSPGTQRVTLRELDLFRGESRTASWTTVQTTAPYLVENDLLYRLDEEDLLITPLIETERALERRIPLPQKSTRVRFLQGPPLLLTLLDLDHKTLYIIDKETRTLYPIQETIEGVHDAVWSPKRNRLVWSTGKALWLLDLERSAREELVQEESKIQELLWHPGNEYLFYTVGDRITVTEIDGRDVRNVQPLVTLAERRGLARDSAGATLYALETDGEEQLVAFSVTNN